MNFEPLKKKTSSPLPPASITASSATARSQQAAGSPAAKSLRAATSSSTLTPPPGFVFGKNGLPREQLDPVQSQKAQAWYRRNAATYTQAVIREIQNRLQMPANGRADAAFVKAVASWQVSYDLFALNDREVPLGNGKSSTVYPATGVLTPEQLSKLFPSGLARPESAKAFAANAQGLSAKWAALGSQDKRRSALYTLLKRLLSSAGVYEPAFLLANMPEQDKGYFSAQNWQLVINSALFNRPQASREEIDNMLLTMYHEVRHAEQLMMVLRLLAGRGMTEQEIKRITSMNGKQVKAAMIKPIAPKSVKGIIAAEWFESYFGSGSAKRRSTLRDLGVDFNAIISANMTELQRLNAQLRQIDQQLKTATGLKKEDLQTDRKMVEAGIRRMTSLIAEQKAQRDGAYPAYRALPEERDAWDIEMQAARNFTVYQGAP